MLDSPLTILSTREAKIGLYIPLADSLKIVTACNANNIYRAANAL